MYSHFGRFNTTRDADFPDLIYKFSAIPIKVSTRFLHGTQEAEKRQNNNPHAPGEGG